jgi:hypothetical protein
MALIAIAIQNEKELLSAEQTELVPIRVTDRQLETQKIKVK